MLLTDWETIEVMVKPTGAGKGEEFWHWSGLFSCFAGTMWEARSCENFSNMFRLYGSRHFRKKKKKEKNMWYLLEEISLLSASFNMGNDVWHPFLYPRNTPLPLECSPAQWLECFAFWLKMDYPCYATVLGDSGGVVNSLDFCPASLKSLGCFYFRCVLSSQFANLQQWICEFYTANFKGIFGGP